MTWTPKYDAGFTKNLIRQLFAVVQRDMRDALDFVAGPNVLTTFQNYQLSATPANQFPSLLMAPIRSKFVQEAVGSLQYQTQIIAALAVAHQDPDVLAEQLQDYIRALDAVFNTLPLSDFSQSRKFHREPLRQKLFRFQNWRPNTFLSGCLDLSPFSR